MAWFKVDDLLSGHKKAAKAGTAALGLWVMCGSWSAGQLTDGFVPDYVARRFDPDADTLAGRLVDAGLWEQAEVDGDTGWQFHDWTGYQPTKAEVEARREYEREKKRGQRRSPSGQFEPGPHLQVLQPVPTESPGDTVGDSGWDTVGSPTVPSRPGPTRTPAVSQTAAAKGSRLPDSFEVTEAMRAWAKTHAPQISVDRETERFIDYWRGKAGAAGRKADWTATWRNWMRTEQERRPGATRPSLASAEGWMNA